jgi:hypothetical protein
VPSGARIRRRAASALAVAPCAKTLGGRKGQTMDRVRYSGQAAQLADAVWHKSSYSNPNGECVEMAPLPSGDVAVRDSKHAGGPVLVISPAQWRTLLARVRGGSGLESLPDSVS